MPKINDSVYAKRRNGAYYPGKIIDVDAGQGAYRVAFDDGDEGKYSVAEILLEPSDVMRKLSELETTCELLRAEVDRLSGYLFGEDHPASRSITKDALGTLVDRHKSIAQQPVDAQTDAATRGKGRM